MTEPIPKRYYTVGDEIRLRVSIVHLQNLKEVRAVFRREFRRENEPRARITFIGDVLETEELGPETEELGSLKHSSSLDPYLRRRSSVSLVSLVDVDHMPGLYELSTLVLQTAGDGEIIIRPVNAFPDLVQTQDAVFRIVEESHYLEEVVVELEDPDE